MALDPAAIISFPAPPHRAQRAGFSHYAHLTLELPEVEEIHTVTGESAMLLKVRTRDTQSLEYLLERIHAIEGFKGTRTYVALSTYLERGPTPQVA